jgi:hypothetical protein
MKRVPSAKDLNSKEGALAEGLLALRQDAAGDKEPAEAKEKPGPTNGKDEVGEGGAGDEASDYYSDTDSDLMDEGDSELDFEGDSDDLDDMDEGDEEDQDEAATLANLTAATKAFGAPHRKGEHSHAVTNCRMLGFKCVNARNHTDECKGRSKELMEKNKSDKAVKKAVMRESRLKAKAEKAAKKALRKEERSNEPKEKKPRGKRGPYKKKDNVGRICIECPCTKVVCKGLCRRCYQKRRKAKESGKPCSTCGRTPSWAKGRCYRCYINVRKGQQGVPRAPRPEPVQVPVEQLEAVVYYQVRQLPHATHEGEGDCERDRTFEKESERGR